MSIEIALAGNPNCGKTTVFNLLTGSDRYVGNWPGVTVEKVTGTPKGHRDVRITDLPGTYSLVPFSAEEKAVTDYLEKEPPNAIINIVDATNPERSLFLTLQLIETGTPIVVLLNMMDAAEKRGDQINANELSKLLGCPVIEASALRGRGLNEAVDKAVSISEKISPPLINIYEDKTETALRSIERIIAPYIKAKGLRSTALNFLMGNSEKEEKNIPEDIIRKLKPFGMNPNDAEMIISREKYRTIEKIIRACFIRGKKGSVFGEKLDSVVLGRFTALPVFAIVMLIVLTLSGLASGKILNLSEIFPSAAHQLMSALNCTQWLTGLVCDGVAAGIGTVLSFLPQLIVLFLLMSVLEDCGYMSRAAFLLDGLFRKAGMSGRSFIPFILGAGCGVAGVSASRAAGSEKERRLTAITATFIPCSAKLPVIAMISSYFLGGQWWMTAVFYLVGAAASVCSCIILGKTKLFGTGTAPFIMELPTYRFPIFKNVFKTVFDRVKSFVKRAGSVIFLASAAVWFLSVFTFSNGTIVMTDRIDESFLRLLCERIAVVFEPLGFGSWQAAAATVIGLVAKEEIAGVFGVLSSLGKGNSPQDVFTAAQAVSFLLFNLMCAPCIAAIGAIKNELKSFRRTALALLYQTLFAYGVSFCFYRFTLALNEGFNVLTAVAGVLTALFVLFLLRPSVSD